MATKQTGSKCNLDSWVSAMQILRLTLLSRWNTLSLLASLIILFISQNVCAFSESPSINLKTKINTPGYQDILFVGSVKKNGKLTYDLAICHSKWKLAGKEDQQIVGESTLVAYIDITDHKKRKIYTPQQICKGSRCKSIDILVNDHNMRFVTSSHGRKCMDQHGILKKSGKGNQSEIEIADLVANQNLELSINVRNTVDEGMMGMDISPVETHQRCEVPPGHQHVRYGRGWYSSSLSASSFLSSKSLYVCSNGIRICIFSNSYMEDPANAAIIIGNRLNNTIMPSGSGFSDPARFCSNEYEPSPPHVDEDWRHYDRPVPSPKLIQKDQGRTSTTRKVIKKKKGKAGSLPDKEIIRERRRYKIDGWIDDWKASLRLFGGDGHDWIEGGPNNDSIYGGNGNDLLTGGSGDNYIFGEEGLDVMHGGQRGMCDGGPPSTDHDCMEGDPTRRWWPYEGTEAGDCCCDSCSINESCYFTDMTPGVTPVDIPPDPW